MVRSRFNLDAQFNSLFFLILHLHAYGDIIFIVFCLYAYAESLSYLADNMHAPIFYL